MEAGAGLPAGDGRVGLVSEEKPSTVGRIIGAVFRSRPWRANARLGASAGTVLAAGIAFYGFFSLFPLLAVGFTVLGLVARGNEQLQADVLAYLQEALPVEGVFAEPGGGDGLVDPAELVGTVTSGAVLGWTGVVALGTLIFTGVGWISALRGGIRGVFELPPTAIDPVRAKLLDLGVLLSLGLLVVVSALTSVVANTLMTQLLAAVGVEGSALGGATARVAVFVTLAVLDTLLFVLLFRALGRMALGWRQLLGGAAVTAVLVGVLKLFAGVLLGGAAGQPALAAFAVPIGLLVWFNLTARATLFGAAWAAVGPAAAEARVPAVRKVPAEPVAGRPAGPAMQPVRHPPAPVLPERLTDRVVLGSGVVLGVAVTVLLNGAGAAARTVGEGLRALVRHDT